MVTDYFVFVTRVSSSGDVSTSDEKFFKSFNSALQYYRCLVGSSVISMNDSFTSFSDNDERYYKLKTRISSSSLSIYVYLCKMK